MLRISELKADIKKCAAVHHMKLLPAVWAVPTDPKIGSRSFCFFSSWWIFLELF